MQTLLTTGRARSREGTRQAEKSDQTRRLILDAAIICLGEIGYTKTTMTVIAKTAGLSRGAMQYHFETMTDVLRATLAHIQELRLERLRQTARETMRGANGDGFAARVEGLWNFMFEPLSVAYLEISVASRTDNDLASLMQQAHESFWNEWVATALEAFPEWEGRQSDLELACGLAHAVLEGLALQRLTHQGSLVRSESVRTYLVDRVREIFEHGTPGASRN
ncbi:TetR/AcrR family transcriptional regulator [Emcibacter sp. SYSU 3D8]|uniref:TetR/AcrR family transcriptional regulator n=1 Tax=Emcibacter sp. SYSU 3D8 TaxID=3133969 RepID=UPI0031FF01BC